MAFVLVQAVLASTGTVSPIHVHEYAGHDHPDHDHGPASHEHRHPPVAEHEKLAWGVDQDQPELQAGSCDPGRHAVAVTMGCAHVPRVHVDIADLPGPTMRSPAPSGGRAASVVDIRVHGPPSETRILPRAPPVAHLA